MKDTLRIMVAASYPRNGKGAVKKIYEDVPVSRIEAVFTPMFERIMDREAQHVAEEMRAQGIAMSEQ